MKIFSLIGIAALTVLLGGGASLYGGAYDFGADRPHWPLTRRIIAAVRERSIAARSSDIAVPDLNDPARLAAGAAHYAPMCAGCHLAPGMADTELRQGLYPQPPDLSRGADAHGHDHGPSDGAARQFWIIKHGIKASGMPAWGRTHDDDAIWGLVAFVRGLPQLSPEDYARLTADAGHGHGQDHDRGDADAGAVPTPQPPPPPAHGGPGHHH